MEDHKDKDVQVYPRCEDCGHCRKLVSGLACHNPRMRLFSTGGNRSRAGQCGVEGREWTPVPTPPLTPAEVVDALLLYFCNQPLVPAVARAMCKAEGDPWLETELGKLGNNLQAVLGWMDADLRETYIRQATSLYGNEVRLKTAARKLASEEGKDA